MAKESRTGKPARSLKTREARIKTMISPTSLSKLQPHLSNLPTPTLAPARSVASAPVYAPSVLRQGITVNGTPVTPMDNSVSTITNTPGNQFNAFRIDELSSLECYRQTMEHKLKGDVFRKLKFITNDAMMEFSVDQQSLCQYICHQMNMKGPQQGPFWTSVKDTVKRMIEKQRTNATSGCKRSFIGKHHTEDDCLLH
jgi:hypothetical protein